MIKLNILDIQDLRHIKNYGTFKETDEIIFKHSKQLKYGITLGSSDKGIRCQMTFGKYNNNKLLPDKPKPLNYGDYFKIDIATEELAKLKNEIDSFENLTKNSNLPKGSSFYQINEENTKNILEQLAEDKNKELVLNKLKELSKINIETLDNLINLSRLKEIIEIWDKNTENPNETFWQDLFEKNSWIFSQLFYFSAVLFNEKTYLGGKGFENKGGKLPDLVYKNNLTKNMCIIEIKTPISNLTGKSYRGKDTHNEIYSSSDELSGAINQLSEYKQQAYLNFISNKHYSENKDIELYNPKCLLIIGKISSLNNESQIRSFELFRNNLRDIEVITYDELFDKLKNLIINIFEK